MYLNEGFGREAVLAIAEVDHVKRSRRYEALGRALAILGYDLISYST